jgi:hypothetical protein
MIGLTQAYLGSEEMVIMLETLKSECQGISPVKSNWLKLLLEVNNGNYSAWLQTAHEVIDQTSPNLIEQHRYLQGLRLLAFYLQGRDDEFVAVYNSVIRDLYDSQAMPFELDLLLGQIMMRQNFRRTVLKR